MQQSLQILLLVQFTPLTFLVILYINEVEIIIVILDIQIYNSVELDGI